MIRPAIANALLGAEHSSLAGPDTLSAVSNDQILSEAGPRTSLSTLAGLTPRQEDVMSQTSAVTLSQESNLTRVEVHKLLLAALPAFARITWSISKGSSSARKREHWARRDQMIEPYAW